MEQLDITNEEYRDIDAISNSELLMIEHTPSDFIWAKNAPKDNTKTAALDFGTVLHTALLEPQKFENSFVIYDQTKSRDTVKFNSFMQEQAENAIVLLESEYDKVRLMAASAHAHPTFSKYLKVCPEREKSIIGDFHGVKVKIRPDLKCDGISTISELKSTADLSEWRESVIWKNPMFKFNYGHSAAFYMDVYQEYLGMPVDTYTYLVCQKSINCGRYPVGVFTISREELTRYGFFDRVYSNIEKYKECKASGDWTHLEPFPLFNVPNVEELDIVYE